MKASIAHGIRPTALILGRDSQKPWNKWDVLFAKAYQRFLNELCAQCGGPKYLCHTDDNRIQFKLRRDECASAARAEQEQDRIANLKAKPKDFGVRLYAEPELTEQAIADGVEFSDLRRPYLIDRARKMGLIPDAPVSETTPEAPVE